MITLKNGETPHTNEDTDMTRIDCELIANALHADAAHLSRMRRRDYSQMSDWEKGAYDQWNTTVLAVADVLRRTNDRFDYSRFVKACKGE